MGDILSKQNSANPTTLAERVRWARRQKGISCEALAVVVGVHKTYISKIENGDAENPAASIAIGLSEALGVGFRWLILGEGEPFPTVPHTSPSVFGGDPAVRNAAMTLLEVLAQKGPIRGVNFPTSDLNSGLPEINDSLTSPPMVPTLNGLILRLTSATQMRGKKSALCAELGVSASRLSQWLSGRRKPDAEMTLRLLAWVQADEAKTKSPASVSPPAGPQTRLRTSSNEKPKSSPP